MKRFTVYVAVMVVYVLIAFALSDAQETQCFTPPSCPACVCNPTLTCADNVAVLPGLWEVSIRSVKRCGILTVYPNGFTLSGNDGSEYFKYNEMGRAARQVEVCP